MEVVFSYYGYHSYDYYFLSNVNYFICFLAYYPLYSLQRNCFIWNQPNRLTLLIWQAMFLFVMIRPSIQYSHSSINLLHEYQPDHLMRESHLWHWNLFVCRLIYFFRKAIRSSDNENQSFIHRIHFPFHIIGKFKGTHLFPVLIQ